MNIAWMAFSQAWQVTLLIVAVVLINRSVARDKPHLAYSLWLVVLLKCITPPLWSSPSGAFSWMQAVAAQAGDSEPTATDVVISVVTDPLPAHENADTFLPHLEPSPPAPTVARVPQTKSKADWGRWLLLCLWGGGVALIATGTGCRWWICFRRLRKSPALEFPELASLTQELAERLRVRRRVKLLVTSCNVGPAVFGLVRPCIVIPELVARDKRPHELEAILAHELIHVRRGDLWLGLLQVCVKAVWWFYPLVWWVSRRAAHEAERCCDEEVVGELGCNPKRYARSLLEVLELKHALRTVPSFPGVKPVEVTTNRLERIMSLEHGCYKRTPPWCRMIMLLLAVTALPGAKFVAAQHEQKSPADSSPPASEPSRVISVQTEVHVPDGGVVLLGGIKRRATYTAGNATQQERTEAQEDETVAVPGRLLVGQGVRSDAGVSGILVTDKRSEIPTVCIVGPMIPRGDSATDPPSDAEIIAAVDAAHADDKTWPQAKDRPQVRIVKELLADYVDRPRVVDTLGRLQLRHQKYKCTVYLRATVERSHPIPHQHDVDMTRVFYVEHLHRIQEPTETKPSTKDPTAAQRSTAQPQVSDSRKIARRLDRELSMDVTNMPLKEVLQLIGKKTQVNIEIDAEDIAVEGLSLSSPVTIKVESPTTADEALATILESLNLRCEFLGDVVIIKGRHSEPLFSAVYNVADLAKAKLDHLLPAGQRPPSGKPVERNLEILQRTIRRRVAPDSWQTNGGRGAVEVFPANLSLVVRQTKRAHRDVSIYLRRLRKELGLPAAIHIRQPPKQSAAATGDVVLRTYYVADLVVPVPGFALSDRPLTDDTDSPLAARTTADFEKLVELIESTVAVDTWESVGGVGRITTVPNSLSLVVAQTAEAHTAIGDLLTQLRRLQDVQITLEARFLRISSELANQLVIDIGDGQQRTIARFAGNGYVGKITEKETRRLIVRASGDDRRMDIVAAPKVTLFNGQQAAISFSDAAGEGTVLHLQAVCSDDRRSVRLQAAVGGKVEVDEVAPQLVIAGHAIALDVTDTVGRDLRTTVTRIEKVPFLGSLPYVGRMFTSEVTASNHRVLLLVTPRIIVQEEEEERVP